MQGEVLTANQAVSAYLNNMRQQSNAIKTLQNNSRKGSGKALFTKIAFFQNAEEVACPNTGENFIVRLFFKVNQPISKSFFAISYNSLEGENKMLLSSELLNKSYQFETGEHFVDCNVNKNPLQAGEYSINLFLKSNNDIVDWLQEALVVEIAPGDFYGTGRTIENGNTSLLIQQNWN